MHGRSTVGAVVCMVLAASTAAWGGVGGIGELAGYVQAWDFADGIPGYEDDDTFSPELILYAGVDTDGDFDDDTSIESSVTATESTAIRIALDGLAGGNGAWSAVVSIELTGVSWLIAESGDLVDLVEFLPDGGAPNPGEIIDTPDGPVASPGAYLLAVNNANYQDLFANDYIKTDQTWTNESGSYNLTLTVLPAPGSLMLLGLAAVTVRRRRR